MRSSFVPPTYLATKFTCPCCEALASMEWHYLNPLNVSIIETGLHCYWASAVCAACGEQSLWLTQSKKPAAKAMASGLQMCYPSVSVGAPPPPDMPPEILQDYQEARAVSKASPRAAAALLRLCIQKLCKRFGQPGKNINDEIHALGADGLSIHTQRAFDTVRIVGNNAVHPGQLDTEDMTATVPKLFQLVLFIIDDLISKPNMVNELYMAMPQGPRDAVDKRDGKV